MYKGGGMDTVQFGGVFDPPFAPFGGKRWENPENPGIREHVLFFFSRNHSSYVNFTERWPPFIFDFLQKFIYAPKLYLHSFWAFSICDFFGSTRFCRSTLWRSRRRARGPIIDLKTVLERSRSPLQKTYKRLSQIRTLNGCKNDLGFIHNIWIHIWILKNLWICWGLGQAYTVICFF